MPRSALLLLPVLGLLPACGGQGGAEQVPGPGVGCTGPCPAAREFWHRAAHPTTGLLPERAEFSGAPRAQEGRDYYGHDNWFTHSNISIDYEWFAEDEWEPQEMARVLGFFATQNPIWDHYTLAGQPHSQYHSNVGHLAGIAGGGIILSSGDSRSFAQKLWDSSPPTGQWRFSTGLVYMMGFMEASGRYRVW